MNSVPVNKSVSLSGFSSGYVSGNEFGIKYMTRYSVDFGDVIVAPASGAGRCAVAVIRMSGQGCAALAGILCDGSGFLSGSIPGDRKMRLSWLKDPESGRTLDQVMIVAYEAGGSFTGEESVEIFCHGGPVIVDSILQACVGLGARVAGPGEFTRRAVAAGRMDLVQAEAVALLTGSENQAAADVGLDALRGRPSESVGRLSDSLIDVLAELEASLDFDEEDDVYVDLSVIPAALDSAVDEMDGWLADSAVARPALTGFQVVLAGLPNAGKSTLFNALAGENRAIVHDSPGTTRDVISQNVVFAGTGCVLSDTAGLRPVDDPVESEGVRRAMKTAANADLVVYAVDGIPGETGRDPVSGYMELQSAGVRQIVTVFTKADLDDFGPDAVTSGDVPGPVFFVSAKTGYGVDDVRSFISKLAHDAVNSAGAVRTVVAGSRQTDALRVARSHVSRAAADLAAEAPTEVVAASVRAAVESIGEITGSHITEKVLVRIFSRFCIGK